MEMNEKYRDTNDHVTETGEASDDGYSALQLSPTSRLLRQAQSRRMDEDPVNKLKSEMIKYESFSLSHREGNILYWWKTHSSLLPMLSRIA